MIKFYAKPDQLVKVPGSQPRPNQPDMYVGRAFDPARRGYFITQEPYEVEEDSDAGRRLIRLTTIDNSLLPADEKTAALCGKEFVKVEFKDGAFVEKKTKSPEKPSA